MEVLSEVAVQCKPERRDVLEIAAGNVLGTHIGGHPHLVVEEERGLVEDGEIQVGVARLLCKHRCRQ